MHQVENPSGSPDLSEEFTAPEIVAEAVNLSQASVEKISAELARLNNSAAAQINAREIDVHQSAIYQAQADILNLQNSPSVTLEAMSLNATNGVIGMARAKDISLDHGVALLAYGETVQVTGSSSGVLLAREIHGGPIRAGVLLAGKVDAPVEAALDTPRALLAGLAAGIGIGLTLTVFRLLGRRKSS